MPSIDSDLLTKELKKKYANQDTTNFGIMDFLAAFGSPVDAIMYLRLFWPDFTLFEDMIFREETLEDDADRQCVQETLKRTAGDKTKTEKSFNLIEIPSGFFSNKASESSDAADEFLAKKLADLWSFRLAMTFPSRNCKVKTLTSQETGGEVGIIFYTHRA